MARPARLIRAAEPEIRPGQVWVPAVYNAPGVADARIVCRYPFARSEDGPVWVVEFLDSVLRIDRMPEVTLRGLWRLEADVPAH